MQRVFALLSYRPLRYLISGGVAALTDLALLYALVDLAHVWYLLASVCGFLAGMVASFLMQKFFTFKNFDQQGVRRQAGLHITLQLINLGVNTLAMYVLVSYLTVPYLAAQVLASGAIALYSFLVYRRFIFVVPSA